MLIIRTVLDHFDRQYARALAQQRISPLPTTSQNVRAPAASNRNYSLLPDKPKDIRGIFLVFHKELSEPEVRANYVQLGVSDMESGAQLWCICYIWRVYQLQEIRV
jgi:hypothetical protein